jgi:uncharacterized protein
MTKRSIVHIEIPARNRETTAKFYSDLFGWEFEHMGEPAPYTLFRTGNVAGGYPDVGGMYRPGDVLIYISSDDLQADLSNIENHGGQVIAPKIDVGEMGTMAIFTDPAGNRMALWKESGR